ncbi:heterokaryon incompatibility protein-domain-containing protein [Immersiella caudata]|uniref:Heterokaryon incompatibility protein-domain-containing protein n=1 Tax=Immersiella caudata TaxID=314043 RepID=A0AA39WJY5_9PEZI|nr:heterokaryon incompatibility protein-domain-containing protein [Immersiella caudata]
MITFAPTRLPEKVESRVVKLVNIAWLSASPIVAFVVVSFEKSLETNKWMCWVPAWSPWSWLLFAPFVITLLLLTWASRLIVFAVLRERASLSVFDYEETLVGTDSIATVTTTSTSYEYEPLPPDTFRLLRLVYDSNSLSGCTISLVQAAYTKPPKYFAVSYTWGDPHAWASQTITVDGRSMAVATNVRRIINFHAPLHKNKAKIIWIDAVCINQRSTGEKTSQVRRMDEIYRNATGVTVWLDDAGDSDNTSARKAHALCWRLFLCRTAADASAVCRGIAMGFDRQLLLRDPQAWEALLVLLTRPWFLRVWVFQEVVLARRVRVVRGGEALPWYLIANAGEMCVRYSNFPVVGETLRRRGNFSNSSDWIEEPPELYHPALFEAHRKREREGKRGRSLDGVTELLRMCRGFLATNPRDKVFALVGLVEDGRRDKRLMADYAKPARVVMLDAARYYLERGRLCDILCEAGIGWDVKTSDPDPTDGRPPSWVPDWATPRPEASSRLSRYPSEEDTNPTPNGFAYRAYGEKSTRPSLMREGASGSLLAWVELARQTIQKLGSVYRPDTDGEGRTTDENEILSAWKWRCEAREIAKASRARYPVAGQIQPREEAFWRTMVADRLDDSHYQRQDRPAPPECAELYRLLVARDELVSEHGPMPRNRLGRVSRLLDMFERAGVSLASTSADFTGFLGQYADMGFFAEESMKTTRGRRFCLTSQGFIGLVPPATKLGDVLCLVPGAQTPFLLRPIGNDAGQFSLVGECYIHGMMDGEAQPSGKESEIQIL